MAWKYAPIPNPNDYTRSDGQAYKEARERGDDALEDVAGLYGVTSEEYAKFEDGEGLIIQDHQELTQHSDGTVRYHDAKPTNRPDGSLRRRSQGVAG